MKHSDLRSTTSIADVKQLLRQPPGNWPAGWSGLANVRQAFVELFAEHLAGATPPPPFDWRHKPTGGGGMTLDDDQSRGIVICGGGWRFLPSIYVTVRMIRRTGCSLPIQIWYLGDQGEFDPRFAAALEPYSVGWVDANEVARQPGRRRRVLGGWELKPFAVAYSPWREVIFLDADAYPVYDPERFMMRDDVRRVGAAFFPDQAPLNAGQFSTFGIEPRVEPSFESGQFYVDKARHWPAICATVFLNDYSDYVYKHVYGDKDTFHLAWRATGHEYIMSGNTPGWQTIAFLQRDPDGRVFVVHRTRDKFRFGVGRVDDRPVADHEWYQTPQWQFGTLNANDRGTVATSPAAGVNNLFVAKLPHERAAHEYMRELDAVLFRPDGINGPTAHPRKIEQTTATITARRRARLTPRVLCTHHRSASQFARLAITRLARDTGLSVRSLSFGGGPTPGDQLGDCDAAAVRSSLDLAWLTTNSNACPEFVKMLDPYADWRGVQIFRDPRDVVVSTYYANRNFHDAEMPGLADEIPRLKTLDLADGLVSTVAWLGWLWDQWRTWPADDARMLRIPFGQLTQHPAATLAAIAAHYEIETTADQAAAIVDRLTFEKLSGGRQVGDTDENAHFRRGVVGSWRDVWSNDVDKAFDRAAGDLLARWGEITDLVKG